MLKWLERRFGRFAVPNLTLLIIVVQVVAFVFSFANPQGLENVQLIPSKVLEGEVWRLATFLVVPPLTHPIFAFFFWYFLYLMGTTLENVWGAFRYNLYLLIGYLATVGAAVLAAVAFGSDMPATNGFLQGTVFLAFAFLYPEFVIYLFFVLPVQIRWIAYLTWGFYLFQFAVGGWLDRLLVVAAVANFMLFFGKEVLFRARLGHRRTIQRAKHLQAREKFFHVCTVCGITDRSHPEMDFRYCSQCVGTKGYCTEHIRNHEHVTAESAAAQASDVAAKQP